jgi:hypothetical protein
MNRRVIWWVLLLLVAGCQPPAQDRGVPFYLQLVRGNDEDSPPTQGSKPVGPKLAEKLQTVFKWKNYWELKRDLVVVQCGQKIRKPLSAERQVEIELLDKNTVKVRIYLNGHLSRCRTQPSKGAFLIAGGDKGQSESWFVIVRRDEPQEPEQNPTRLNQL